MAVTAIVHFGEHCSFWGATNKSAVTAPQNEHMKKPLENGSFLTQIVNKIGQKKHCEIDRYFGKVFWAKKSAQLVIPVRSTFKNDLHPPIGGPHPVPYFTTR